MITKVGYSLYFKSCQSHHHHQVQYASEVLYTEVKPSIYFYSTVKTIVPINNHGSFKVYDPLVIFNGFYDIFNIASTPLQSSPTATPSLKSIYYGLDRHLVRTGETQFNSLFQPRQPCPLESLRNNSNPLLLILLFNPSTGFGNC